jgi:hypothetical protein
VAFHPHNTNGKAFATFRILTNDWPTHPKILRCLVHLNSGLDGARRVNAWQAGSKSNVSNNLRPKEPPYILC